MLCSWRSLPFAVTMLVIEDIEGFDEGGEERVSEDIDEMEEPEKD